MPKALSEKKSVPPGSPVHGTFLRCRAALRCLFVASAFFIGCGGNGKAPPVVVIGTDTLLIEAVRLLAPDAKDDSAAIKQAVRRMLLARVLPPQEKQWATVAGKLAQKLSLVTGADYTARAAELLLDAAAVFDRVTRSGGPAHTIAASVDSILSARTVTAEGTPFGCRLSNEERALVKGFSATDEKQRVRLFASLFALSGEAAATVVSFLAPEDSGAAVDTMIKGLIADPNAPVKRTAPAMKQAPPDPAKALSFRSQGSIRDSIARHQTNLQQLYKRYLKGGDVTSGTVWVTFQVNAEGRVTGVRILKSEISNTQFLERLGQYVRLITFKQIPESAGSMTFEFPFEFTTEEL